MTDASLYQLRGFGGAIGFGARPALLIIDFVNGFMYRDDQGDGMIPQAARRTEALLATARAVGLPIVFTRIVYAEDGSDAGVWALKSPRLLRLTESAEASQIVSALSPRSGERIVRKTQASAFFGTDLATHLIGKGVDTVIFAGCTTSGCVRASVVDAISHNFRPILAHDCIGDRAKGPHAANLFDMGQKYADLVSCDDVIAHLEHAAVIA